MDTINENRRKWLGLGAASFALSLLPGQTLAALSTPKPRLLRFHNMHTGEALTTEFFDGRRYNSSELVRLNHLFRDHRTNQVMRIDPQLFDQMYLLQMMMGIDKPVQLISGYRSLETNNKLRRTTNGVAKHSFHTRGQAMDFYINGVQLAHVRKAALAMSAGGVGYYPRSNFIHIDTGRVRNW